MVSWLSAAPAILHSTLLIPFITFWGIAFAHHVGLLILAHLTKSPFPAIWKHPLLILSVLGSVDANAYRWGGWESVVRGHEKWVVGASVALAVAVYAHFVTDVIGDICAYFDIKCVFSRFLSRGRMELMPRVPLQLFDDQAQGWGEEAARDGGEWEWGEWEEGLRGVSLEEGRRIEERSLAWRAGGGRGGDTAYSGDTLYPNTRATFYVSSSQRGSRVELEGTSYKVLGPR